MNELKYNNVTREYVARDAAVVKQLHEAFLKKLKGAQKVLCVHLANEF